MDPRWTFLGLACSTLAFAQAPAPAVSAAGAPVGFPAPSYLPAGAGAPIVGQPGQPLPLPLPRSPDRRILPPAVEPGLWAADEVHAAKKRAPPLPDVDELLRPQPAPGTPELASCRERVRWASRDSGLEDVRRSLTGSNRECLTVRLLQECWWRENLEFTERLKKTPQTPEVTREFKRQEKEGERVLRWAEQVCGGFLSLPYLEALHATVHAHLERQFSRPEVRR